jgi:hypothetical protein
VETVEALMSLISIVQWSEEQIRATTRKGRKRPTVFGLHEPDQLRTEVVPELLESIPQLAAVDGTRLIPIEVTEYVLPVLCSFVD